MNGEKEYASEEILEEEGLIVPMELENGKRIDCQVVATFDCEGIDYIALLPEETEELILFRFIFLENDEIQIINIDDEIEWERVVRHLEELLEEE